MTKPLVDCLGNDIQVGDKVLYAAADGRSSVLRRGVVSAVGYRPTEESYYDRNLARYTRRTVQAPRIRVESEYYCRHDGWEEQKAVTLKFPERIVVVDKSAW
jgi:hypothetical protein